jgi:DNA-binding HxlR family transcriptional regulator
MDPVMHLGRISAPQQRGENMSSSVLHQRLTELAEARIVEQRPNTSYALTPLGQDAYQALRPLVRWSARWAGQLHPDDPSST